MSVCDCLGLKNNSCQEFLLYSGDSEHTYSNCGKLELEDKNYLIQSDVKMRENLSIEIKMKLMAHRYICPTVG